MARSKSSAGYPASFNALIGIVGEQRKEVSIPVMGTGLHANSLRTTVQCFVAAVKKEGINEPVGSLLRMKAEHASKIIVRVQGDSVVVSHRDTDVVGIAMSSAIEHAMATSGARGPLDTTSVYEVSKEMQASWTVPTETETLQDAIASGRVKRVNRPPATDPAELLSELDQLPGDGPIATAPGSMLDMVAHENSAPRPAAEQKYKRQDGKAYPEEADGEPTWGFTDTGEPKLNQYF